MMIGQLVRSKKSLRNAEFEYSGDDTLFEMMQGGIYLC